MITATNLYRWLMNQLVVVAKVSPVGGLSPPQIGRLGSRGSNVWALTMAAQVLL